MEASGQVLPIELRGVTKTYRIGFWMSRRVHALKGIDLTVASGQVYGLLGPNGAGKSTSIKILMNLVHPSSGEARLFGRDPSDRSARREVGFVPENPAPYEYLTGREMVTMAGALSGVTRHELDERVKTVIASVGMERTADLQIRRYSKGMLQRICLAQALVNQPKLLVLDEPTSGLDPVGRREMRDIILEQRQRGTTVLFCTHIIPDVEALCDRVAVLVGGRLVREGSVRDLLAEAAPVVELGLEGISAEGVKDLGFRLEWQQQVGQSLLVRIAESDAQGLLKSALAAGGRVTYVHPVRYSLEDLFLKTLKEAGHHGAGAEIL